MKAAKEVNFARTCDSQDLAVFMFVCQRPQPLYRWTDEKCINFPPVISFALSPTKLVLLQNGYLYNSLRKPLYTVKNYELLRKYGIEEMNDYLNEFLRFQLTRLPDARYDLQGGYACQYYTSFRCVCFIFCRVHPYFSPNHCLDSRQRL
jgi:hypothetical protein